MANNNGINGGEHARVIVTVQVCGIRLDGIAVVKYPMRNGMMTAFFLPEQLERLEVVGTPSLTPDPSGSIPVG